MIVELLCARAAGAPSAEELRPRFCTRCGQLSWDGGKVWVQGHGFYSRQVCGLSAGWMESRLGIRKAAETRQQGQAHLTRWLGEMRLAWESPAKVDRKSTRLNSSHVAISYAV